MKEPWFHIISEIAARNEPAVRDIQLAACRHFKVNLRNMVGQRRSKNTVMPRHVAMYLARELTERSLPTIALSFKRDHTTIMAGCRKIDRLVAANDKRVMAALTVLRVELGRAA